MACKEVALNCEVEEMPGKRALASANMGDSDGDASRVIKIKEVSPEDSTNLSVVNEPSVEVEWSVIVKEGTALADAPTWKDLEKFDKVAFVRGSKTIEKNVPEAKHLPSQDIESTFRLLEEGRAQAIVMFKLSALKYIKDKGLKGFKLSAKPLLVDKLYPWVNNSQKDLIPKLEEGLKKIKANGKFKEIQDKVTASLL